MNIYSYSVKSLAFVYIRRLIYSFRHTSALKLPSCNVAKHVWKKMADLWSSGRWSQLSMVRILLSNGITLHTHTHNKWKEKEDLFDLGKKNTASKYWHHTDLSSQRSVMGITTRSVHFLVHFLAHFFFLKGVLHQLQLKQSGAKWTWPNHSTVGMPWHNL